MTTYCDVCGEPWYRRLGGVKVCRACFTRFIYEQWTFEPLSPSRCRERAYGG